MLSDKLRNGANSKGFKLLMGLIVVSFVLTGVGGYLIPRLNTDPVTIGDYKISANEWNEQYNRRAQQLHRYGPQAAVLLENPAYVTSLKKSVLEDMINNVAFNSAVWDLNIRIGDAQVREVIRNTSAFQKDGRFDNDLYLATVRNMGMNPDYFGEQLRISLMSEAISQPLLSISSVPMPYELKETAKLIAQRRVVNLYQADTLAIDKAVEVNESEAEQYYNNHHQEFMAPANVRFKYLLLSVEALKQEVEVTENKLEEYFNLYQDDFAKAEERQASHLLIKADAKDAQERIAAVAQALAEGKSLGELTAQYSDDSATKDKHGDLGLVGRGQLSATLDNALFSLTAAGDVSEPIVDADGTHFIALTKLVPAHIPHLDEVKEQVTTAYINAQARDLYNTRVSTLSDLSFENPDSLDVAAEATKLTVQDSGLIKQGDSDVEWPMNMGEVQSLAFDPEVYNAGVNSQVIAIDEDNSIVINVSEHHDAVLRPFAEVKEDSLAAVKQEKIKQVSYNTLANLAKSLQQDPNTALPDNISVQENIELSIGSSAVSPLYSQAIFALPQDETRSFVIADNNGLETLAVLQKVLPADEDTLSSYQQILSVQYNNYLTLTAQQALYRQARSLSKIEYNEDAINLITRNNEAE